MTDRFQLVQSKVSQYSANTNIKSLIVLSNLFIFSRESDSTFTIVCSSICPSVSKDHNKMSSKKFCTKLNKFEANIRYINIRFANSTIGIHSIQAEKIKF